MQNNDCRDIAEKYKKFIAEFSSWKSETDLKRHEKTRRPSLISRGEELDQILKKDLWNRELRFALAEKKLKNAQELLRSALATGKFAIKKNFFIKPETEDEKNLINSFSEEVILAQIESKNNDKTFFSTPIYFFKGLDSDGIPGISGFWKDKYTRGVVKASREFQLGNVAESAARNFCKYCVYLKVYFIIDIRGTKLAPRCLIVIRTNIA